MLGSLAFTAPAMLFALAALPLIWWLLKLTPPRPKHEVFPPLKILATVLKREETPSKSPWWLTLLRMLIAALVIFALAGPVLNPRTSSLVSGGPLVIVMDNSWATAPDWERRVATAEALIDDAESRDLPVSLTFTADRQHDAIAQTAAVARERLSAAAPRPLPGDRDGAITALREALEGTQPGTLAFVTDGIRNAENDDTVRRLAELQPSELRVIEGDGTQATAITNATNASDSMTVRIARLNGADAASIPLSAEDAQGRVIANGSVDFGPGATTADAAINAPFEIRNDFARIRLGIGGTAGSVHLLDDAFKRRRIVLLSGSSNDEFQPLLSPLYYIEKALQPYADLIKPDQADLAAAIPAMLENNPSMIIMADIGRLPEGTYEPLQRWIANGGLLLRFAGPRLAGAPAEDPLIPVTLRQGERALGGTLSWGEPQPLAEFPETGPFAGLPRPADVVIDRQVLAEPTPDLAERTWASLADGTPLVTTRKVNAGQIVLFHIAADATWSNLPISGSFVEMLRRVVQVSRSGGASSNAGSDVSSAQTLPPYRMLDAKGVLVSETGTARPLPVNAGISQASFDNPPGLYGSEDGFMSLNVLPQNAELQPLSMDGANVVRAGLVGGDSVSIKPPLLVIALILFFLDSLVVILMNGALPRMRRAPRAAAMLLIVAGATAFMAPGQSLAQGTPSAQDDTKPGDDTIFERLDNTHLAYIVTGEQEVDRISERGLAGLTEFLTYRTTLEPAAPVGLNLETDELSFYPMIYWPISANAPMPSTASINRVDAYMRQGGTVLFDTRDQVSSLENDANTTPNGQRLQEILANLDIPPLEPVPADHVLTKTFYLLQAFPGRYSGSPLWIESRQVSANSNNRTAANADGVSPIMITGNDFAGAWAIDQNGAPMLPTVPADPVQREYAFRAGVNIMMFMLTGNYKADQVHLPALLERLGQ